MPSVELWFLNVNQASFTNASLYRVPKFSDKVKLKIVKGHGIFTMINARVVSYSTLVVAIGNAAFVLVKPEMERPTSFAYIKLLADVAR